MLTHLIIIITRVLILLAPIFQQNSNLVYLFISCDLYKNTTKKRITTILGPTEYEKRFLQPNITDLKEAQYAHSINNQQLKMHYLRTKKFEEPEKHLKITGNTENRVRYQNNDKSYYIKKMVTRSDNEIIAKKTSSVSGTTEYIDRYNPIVKLKKQQSDATPPFTINPKPDLLAASNQRPYDNVFIREEDKKGIFKTQFQYVHKWPTDKDLDKFPWIKQL